MKIAQQCGTRQVKRRRVLNSMSLGVIEWLPPFLLVAFVGGARSRLLVLRYCFLCRPPPR